MVEGLAYLYLTKLRHGQATPEANELVITVQADTEDPGRVLQFTLSAETSHGPEEVKQAILRGLAAGWDPSAKGAAFILDNSTPTPDR